MCGRFSLFSEREKIVDAFGVKIPKYVARYNIAPTQDALVITNDDPEQTQNIRWGLIPHWAKDEKIGNKLINARAETIAEKPAFRDSFINKRCAIIADGFYEWKSTGKTKQPFRITSTDGLFALAGIWDEWQGKKTFTIITCEPNNIVNKVHNRMPVMLRPEDVNDWLHTPSHKLLQPYPAENTRMQSVSTRINSPKNDGPEVLVQEQQTL